ncbi:MAG: HD domain-containing phosphohydrolase [Pseudomonadota bacterium]
MLPYILLLTDDIERSKKCIINLEAKFVIEIIHVFKQDIDNVNEAPLLIIDVNLTNPTVVHKIKGILEKANKGRPKIFLTNLKSGTFNVQAERLNASEIFAHNTKMNEFEFCIKKHMNSSIGNVWKNSTQGEKKAFKSVESVNDQIINALSNGIPLPKAEINSSSDLIISSLEGKGISSWLESVKQHHSYTHRHCITVTGIAVAFGKYFKMKDADLHRLAIGALVHDIGKVRIPLSILDKPGKLNEEERTLMETHPVHSYDILTADGQFDAEIINMARHHHEYLDGTGYPDGLKADQINNLVRIMTIIDIFSALIDQRSYKESMSHEQAYNILLTMEGKLDSDFLKAFQPVALEMASQNIEQHAKEVAAV